MKNSKVKKSIAVLTAAVLTMSVQSFVLAAEESEVNIKDSAIIIPKNIAISDTECRIAISGTTANCIGETYVTSAYTSKVIVELQQYNGGWKTIKTWTKTGGVAAVINENYTINTGYSYCIKVTHKAYNSAGVEVESITTYDYV